MDASQRGSADERTRSPVARLTRAELLRGALATGVGLGAAGVLAACGGGGEEASATETVAQTGAPGTTAAPTRTEEGQPTAGGRLRLGLIGGGQSETFNPGLLNSPIDAIRGYCVFDPLVRPGPDFTYEPGLALEWTPNADATVWEIKLREGVTWHDGKPFTADDVIYSFRAMGDPAHFGHGSVVNMRLDELRKLGDLTVEVPLQRPNAQLFDSFVYFNSAFVIQDGTTDFSNPIGTGPYMFDSFTPGQRSLSKRNPSYWEEGKPYPDEIEIVSIDDNDARLNALLSGEIDAMQPLPGPLARAQQEAGQINVLEAVGGPGQFIYMRIDVEPFRDVRVRQAMKLIADRQALIDGAFGGFGTVLNDLPGKGLPYYADSLPQREQDIEQAKSLLRAAGAEGFRVTLQTSPVLPGLVESATLFAEQAKAAGVTIDVEQEEPSSYFNPTLLYLKMPFAQDSWPTASLAQLYELLLLTDSPVNQTHYRDPAFDELFWRARGETDDETARELWLEVQRKQWEEGGNIIWASRNSVDGLSMQVQGMTPGWVYPLGDFRVWDWWLAT